MSPFGFPIVMYLFLAGIAAGAAFIGSFALATGRRGPFGRGRRALVVAVLCALAGAVFLIFDLARPEEFFLILTSANTSSAIAWGARILVVFILSATFVWATVRSWGGLEIERGFRGADAAGLWLLRLAALGLAIYPAFVLRQGDAFPLWQDPLLIPLIAVSAFHAGAAASLLTSPRSDCRRNARMLEIALGVAQAALLAAIFVAGGSSPLAWVGALAAGTLLPLILAFVSPEATFTPRLLLILLGTFAVRYWLIAAGQSI